MSWRDEMEDGSFRGAPFFSEEHERSGGHRKTIHEYPGRNTHYVENSGQKSGAFSISAYVIGQNYRAARDALEEALLADGPGELVHPWRGRLRVEVLDFKLRETTRKGGMAEFTIEFVPAGENLQPATTVDSRSAAAAAATALSATSAAAFEDSFSVAGQPGWSVARVTDTLNDIASQIRGNTSKLVGQMSQPGALADSLIGAAASVVREGELAIRAFERAMDLRSTVPSFTVGSEIDRARTRNEWALTSLVRQAAISQAALAASNEQPESSDDATRLLMVASDAISAVQEDVDPFGQPVDSAIYDALSDVRAALVTHIQRVGLPLPRIQHYSPATTMPALVLAQSLYGDALRDADIIRRNRIRYPGFVPGGETLEVLVDV